MAAPPGKQRRAWLRAATACALLGVWPIPDVLARKTRRSARASSVLDGMTERMRFGWLGRSDVQEFIFDLAQRHNMDRQWLQQQFDGLGVQPRALTLLNPPPPAPGEPVRKRSWSRYLSQHADAARILEGKEFLQTHRSVFADVQQRTGVPAHVIAGIIGVETRYGKIMGNFPALETLTTLAFESPRRASFFRQELETLLVLGKDGALPLREARGSFAGALGMPQFMPSSWRNFAVGYRDARKPDLLNNPADAIASVGNFLQQHGWKRDEPSHTKAVVPSSMNAGPYVAPGLAPAHTVADLQAAGIGQSPEVLPASMRASLIDLPEEDDSVRYWMAAHNFFVITQYNRSFMYAAAVLTLAEAVRESAPNQA